MSGTEDYLDGLLNSISEKDLDTKKKTGSETMQTEEDIMNDMENDLLSKEAEDNFLEQFEKELQNEKSSPEEEKRKSETRIAPCQAPGKTSCHRS
jgi:hypothetical protein